MKRPAPPQYSDGTDIINDMDDDLWLEDAKQYIPDVIWNPKARTETLKGGPGSGNFGHSGIPGHHGGSAPRNGASAGYALSRSNNGFVPYVPDRESQGLPTENFGYGLMGLDSESGLSVEPWIIDANERSGELNVEAMIKKGNNPAGELHITGRGSDLTLELLSVHEGYQDIGFGSRYYMHLEKQAIKHRINSISLIANLSAGGYVWARLGFDFSSKQALVDMRRKADRVWKQTYDEFMPDSVHDAIKHSWDIAALVGPDGRRIGKDIMLGSKWQGRKWLVKSGKDDYGDDLSLGYNVGYSYFRNKEHSYG